MSQRLGFGVSGPLGQAWFAESVTRSVIETALFGRIAHFDTGPFYFDAETRLGEALKTFGRNDVFVSTKTGTRRKGRRLVKDFSDAGIRADVDRSRRRLGRETLDLLYLHGPTSKQIDETKPALEALKRDGKIARIGVCGEGDPLRHAVDVGFDAIMGVYNMADRRHEKIFAHAKTRGVMTTAISPLAQGIFDRRFFLPGDLADIWRMARAALRGRYAARQIAMVKEAVGEASPIDAALGFALANGDIDIVMTTTTKSAHLSEALSASGRAIDPAVLARLRNLALDPPYDGA